MLLRDAHAALGGRLGRLGDTEVVLDYAAPDREAAWLGSVGVADWGHHGVLTLRGRDAVRFLHNLVSSSVATMPEGGAQPSLLLDAKGKVVGMLRVWRHERDHLDLLCEAPGFPAAKAAFARYARVAKLGLEDRSHELGLLLVLGPRAREAVRDALACEPPPPGRVLETPAGNVLAHDALASPRGFLLAVRAEQARDAWQRLLEAARKHGGGPAGWLAVEDARVRAGIPRAGAEVKPDTLPPEAGLGAALDYGKGCFVGQEVVARIKNLGHVNRLAVRLAPEGSCEPGDALRASGEEVGRVTSVARGPGPPAALGVVRRGHAAPGTRLDLAKGAARVLGPAQLPP